jgi:hypothetical protein
MLSALTDDRTLLTDLFGLVLAARARLATFSVGVEKSVGYSVRHRAFRRQLASSVSRERATGVFLRSATGGHRPRWASRWG